MYDNVAKYLQYQIKYRYKTKYIKMYDNVAKYLQSIR
jgi:hypothetical protein